MDNVDNILENINNDINILGTVTSLKKMINLYNSIKKNIDNVADIINIYDTNIKNICNIDNETKIISDDEFSNNMIELENIKASIDKNNINDMMIIFKEVVKKIKDCEKYLIEQKNDIAYI